MASMDRYRPQREGYQPPSLPPKPKPLPAAIDRLSNSPSRRRDVPPAVPSPPTHTSRTSPPRPHSRRSAHSPSQSSPPPTPQPRPNQWLFTPDEVASTPSIIEGLSVAEDRLRRAKGVNFIYQAGILLELPQVTLWVAGVFFHRFYMRYSMREEKGGIHHYNIAATALFLANKTEENCRKTKELIIAVAKVAQKNAKLIIDEQSKEYWKWRDSILTYEELMLETLTYDLMVENPYQRMHDILSQLGLIQNKRIRDSVWAFCNDSCLTVLPLMLGARDMAIAAIFFATCVTREKIDDVNGEPWWKFLKGSETHTVRAVKLMCDFYRENPLRKHDTKVPGSPEFNLESTRRRGEESLSQMDLDSSQYGTPTPLALDRGATPQSPARSGARVNGKTESDSKDVAIKKEYPSDSSVTKAGDEPPAAESSSEEQLALQQMRDRGDSDAALKAAANDLSTHDGRSSTLNGSTGGGLVSPQIKSGGGLVSPQINTGGGLVSPQIGSGGGLVSPRVNKRKSEDPEEGLERGVKRARLDEDEGEIKES